MTEISTEAMETVSEIRNETGTAEQNTFQGLAKSTLDIKKNRKRKEHNRRLSIDSQYKSVSAKYNEGNLLQAIVRLKTALTILKILKILVPRLPWKVLPLISTAVATALIVIGEIFVYACAWFSFFCKNNTIRRNIRIKFDTRYIIYNIYIR